MSEKRAGLVILAVAGASFGIIAEVTTFRWNEAGNWAPDLIVGWCLIACGLVGWHRRPESWIGPLLTASGFAWFLGTVSVYALYLHRGPLIHALLSFPTGRPNSVADRTSIAAGYLAATITPVGRNAPVLIAIGALVISSAVRGVVVSVGRERRARIAVLPTAIGLGLVLAGGAIARRVFESETSGEVLLAVYQIVLFAIAIHLVLQLVHGTWDRVAVTDLVLGLQESRTNTVRDALARAIGDPSLQIGYRAESGSYVDESGVEIEPLQDRSHRAVTHVELDGRSVALLVHDPSVLQDPGLIDSIAAAARLTAANARLRAEVRAQMDELRLSRRRFLQAGERERRRLEQRLRARAGLRLKSLGSELERARIRATQTDKRDLAGMIRRAEQRLAAAEAELRELARGLHPFALTTTGLAGAIAELGESAPLPTDVLVSAGGLPDEVATTAYYICSEALANIVKHARATRCSIRIERHGTKLLVAIDDDGVGGADVSKGSGLRGLMDRAEVVGGTLHVEGEPGAGGTRITADIPLGVDATA